MHDCRNNETTGVRSNRCKMQFYRSQRSCSKVMFLHLSLSHSVHMEGVSVSGPGECLPHTPSRHPLWQTPPGRHLPPPMSNHLPTECLLGYTQPKPSAYWDTKPLPSACWDTPPCAVHARIWSTSRQYASHWNAFLFKELTQLKFYNYRDQI